MEEGDPARRASFGRFGDTVGAFLCLPQGFINPE
jgi:hypothetical protein